MLKINYSVPTFGDHKFIFIELNFFAPLNVSTFYRREWSNYDQNLINDKMKHELLLINNVIEDGLTVNELWNLLENVLINTIDLIAPLSEVKISAKTKRTDMALHIKGKITKRKRLLHYNRINNCSLRISEIKVLNKEINNYFESKRAGNVRKAALGPNTNIWKAVKLAKNICLHDIPLNMTLGGVNVPPADIANAFASFFSKKIKTNSDMASIKDNVYNGKCRLIVQNRNFMSANDVEICLNELSSKKCEGFDRIPVCLIHDCRAALLPSLTVLFNKIYSTGLLPDQWKVSKIVPIFKKGNKDEIDYYSVHLLLPSDNC